MRQLDKNEFISVSAGCSACQQHHLSVTAATVNGTMFGAAVAACLFAVPVSAPVAIGSGILAFAGASYFTYYNTIDSFISAAA